MSTNLILYVVAFISTLVLTLLLTPIVREMNRRFGMVDRPDPRRINTVPVPRGGGLAIYVSIAVTFVTMDFVFGEPAVSGFTSRHWVLTPLAGAITLLGYADDKFSLSPRVKLFGQVAIAALSWWVADLGFRDMWPALPLALDGVLTVLWIVGAVNAFNLIDGLDGLASGLALIATVGMAGGFMFSGHTSGLLFYFLFAGALLGFLRYNYNPASVFLGDSGSMLVGFSVSVLPLCSHSSDSFLVSIGVPLLAMGVPIFDTALAILRRTVRHALVKRSVSTLGAGDSAEVMSADHDHLHHRILRAVGLNQRKAAWSLYILAIFLVGTGLVVVYFQSRAEAVWLVALAVALFVVFRDMSRVEFFDMGRLLNTVAHSTDRASRRLWARLAVPFYLVFDLLAVTGVFLFCLWLFHDENPWNGYFRISLLVRVSLIFVALVVSRTYSTIWARALPSNFVRLFLACVFGSLAGSVVLCFSHMGMIPHLKVFTFLFAALVFLALVVVRTIRPLVRDFFYALDCSKLVRRKDVSRVLVYGAGIRYRAFRRELVRRASINNRIIVGLLDDDILLRGHYIGGLRVLGTMNDAPEIINAVNADRVVIACDISDAWLQVVRDILEPTGVHISHFTLQEKELI